MKLGEFREGQRVRLLDESIEEEKNGTVVKLIVTEVVVRFDDNVEIHFDANDQDFEAIND